MCLYLIWVLDGIKSAYAAEKLENKIIVQKLKDSLNTILLRFFRPDIIHDTVIYILIF